MNKCRLNIALMGAKYVFVYLLGEMALLKIYSLVSFPWYFLALIQCNFDSHRKGDITIVIKSHQTILYSQTPPRNEPKAHQSLHKPEVASVFLKSSRSDVPSHVEQVNVQGCLN